ncbi:hypothetical protein GCM10009332_01350 [Shewanella gelidii]|uniref:Uncharacterized protein n=2 Tax=Shewanella gelidii TaxID=1642821 RepID=A0A917N5N5_9GAMM|nr:hypothetical protein GCM10009332_01350 [Shewanella gelidii]
MWFWAILTAGVFVAISPYLPKFTDSGKHFAVSLSTVIAGVSACFSICAVGLGLLAATVGGNFRLDVEEAWLLILFGLTAIMGIILVVVNRRDIKNSQQFEA